MHSCGPNTCLQFRVPAAQPARQHSLTRDESCPYPCNLIGRRSLAFLGSHGLARRGLENDRLFAFEAACRLAAAALTLCLCACPTSPCADVRQMDNQSSNQVFNQAIKFDCLVEWTSDGRRADRSGCSPRAFLEVRNHQQNTRDALVP